MTHRLWLLIRFVREKLIRFRNTKSSIQLKSGLRPGSRGERLPDGVVVLRLAKPSKDATAKPMATEAHFSLSTEDEESPLKSLTVWARDLTPATRARELMGENRAAYCLVLHLKVDDIRALRLTPDSPQTPLDVVWDPDTRPGAEGHAGITGLKRPPHVEKKIYKRLRTRLADLAKAELLDE